MRFRGYGIHVLNVSVSTQQGAGAVEAAEAALAGPLMELAAAIQLRMQRLEDEGSG